MTQEAEPGRRESTCPISITYLLGDNSHFTLNVHFCTNKVGHVTPTPQTCRVAVPVKGSPVDGPSPRWVFWGGEGVGFWIPVIAAMGLSPRSCGCCLPLPAPAPEALGSSSLAPSCIIHGAQLSAEGNLLSDRPNILTQNHLGKTPLKRERRKKIENKTKVFGGK